MQAHLPEAPVQDPCSDRAARFVLTRSAINATSFVTVRLFHSAGYITVISTADACLLLPFILGQTIGSYHPDYSLCLQIITDQPIDDYAERM